MLFLASVLIEEIIITKLVPAAVAVLLGIGLSIWQGFNWYTVIVVSVASGLITVAAITTLRALYTFVRTSPIDIRHVPDKTPAILVNGEAWVHLAVKNNRRSDNFVAQVVGIDGAEHAEYETLPWSIKWRGWKDEERPIAHKAEQILDLAQARVPRTGGLRGGAWERGAFRFCSTDPSWVKWVCIEGTQSMDQEYERTMAVRVRINSIGRGEFGGYSIERTLRLGFNRDFMAEGHLRLLIEK